MRKRSEDMLLASKFHLIDVNPSILGLYPFVFAPGIGFTSISAPSLTADTVTITPGNAYFGHQVVRRATLAPITASRGIYLGNFEFWQWFVTTLTGEVGSINAMRGGRRSLMLMQFSSQGQAKLAKESERSRSSATSQWNIGGIQNSIAGAASLVQIAQVPARAWILTDCLPVGYVPASDFSSTSNEVSLQNLTLSYSDIDELSLG